MTTKLLLLSLCLILVAGCSSTSPTILPTESTQIPSPIIPTATLIPKPVDTQTPTRVILTSTDLPIMSCENNGLPVGSATFFDLSGEVLLKSTIQTKLSALNLETQGIATLYSDINSDVSIFGSSPDGKWFAYAIHPLDTNGDTKEKFTLELLSHTGESIHRQMSVSLFESIIHPDSFAGFGPSYWINNELIYTTLVIDYRNAFGSTLAISTPIILNPFTGSWEESLLLSTSRLRPETETGFSPDLQRVVVQGREITLKDLKTGKELWATHEFKLEMPDSKVRWSPNGKMVAIGWLSSEPEIFLITADGNTIEKLLPIGTTEGSLEFQWSPNSQFLMLYQESYNEQGGAVKEFYLYDTFQEQIVLQCPVPQPWSVLFQWSPDSNQVMYGTYEASLLVLDIPSGRVVDLGIKDVVPISWTEKPFPQ